MNVPEKKDNAARTANFISAINVLVAATLAVFTYLLFNQATKDSTTAEKSSTAAQDAVKEQRFNDSINRIEQIKKDFTDSITRKITFASIKTSDSISKATLQQQINSFKNDSISKHVSDSISKENLEEQVDFLNETRKEFEIANTPYLECTGFKLSIDSFKKGHVTFYINNLGVQTEKILNGGFSLYFSGFHNDFDLESMNGILPDNNLINKYIAKESPVLVSHEQPYTASKSIIDAIKNNRGWYDYFYGEIIYINEVTKKKREYLFYIRFRSVGGYDIIKNENKDLN